MSFESENLFPDGARWVRADFHMHTVADDEFERPAEGVNFISAFVERLVDEQISVGVITNHNKLNQEEYKSLCKAALKSGIFLLPGVELEVQGGNGVHLLVVFEPETWIWNKENEPFIDRFLDRAFDQIPNRATKDTACNWTTGQLLDHLAECRKHGRDSFVIAAHVDRSKGILKELGSKIGTHFNELFRQTVLGFQRVEEGGGWRNLNQWLADGWRPARVEGSDCKSLATVGRAHVEGGEEKRTWIKLSDFSFAAVKLALIMKDYRLAARPLEPQSAGLLSVTWTGANGLLDGQTLHFNRDLNNIIGIRGSGKSSVVESLRDVLDLNLKKAEDEGYKRGLVERTLGSGGKMVAEVCNCDGVRYRIERILGESARVFRDGHAIPNLKVSGVLTARYFGQKDLAKFGEREFQRELIERFTGGADAAVGRELLLGIEQRLVQIRQGKTKATRREEVEAKLAQTQEALEQFSKLGLEEKLKAQIALEKDVVQARRNVELAQGIAEDIENLVDDHERGIASAKEHKPSGDGSHFRPTAKGLESLSQILTKLRALAAEAITAESVAREALAGLEEFHSAKKEEFAEQRRSIHISGELRADTFVELTRQKQILEAEKKGLDELEKTSRTLQDALRKDLISLQQHWQADYQNRLGDVRKLNDRSKELQIALTFKGDREAFVEMLKTLTSGLLRSTLTKVAETFQDGIELFFDLCADGKRLTESGLKSEQIVKLRESLEPNLNELLTSRPPDEVTINYNGKLLQDHSLGQRATALMLFLLSQKDFDILIVDQPEDDLDNQTLYNEVIKRLLALKGERQVIFATHSPNIPVLGDADQIVRCRYSESHVDLASGGIDSPAMQKEIIDVMEGGEDAFNLRKKIYGTWKH